MAGIDCYKCAKELPDEGGFVTCQGCDECYHYGECSISLSTYNGMGSKKKASWRCEKCREHKDTRKPREDSSSMDATLTPNEMLKVRSEIADVKSILVELRDQMKDIIKSQQFLSAQYDEIKTGQELIESHLKKMEGRIGQIKDENKERDSKIEELTKRIIQLEQHENDKKLEIHGIEESPGENIEEKMLNIAAKLNVKLEVRDLESAQRVHAWHKEGPSPVIVEFRSVKICNNIKEKKRSIINNKDVSGGNSERKIYIYEYLSAYYKKLLWETKQHAREKGWKYVWVQNSRVLVRKNDGSRILNIRDPTDFAKIN